MTNLVSDGDAERPQDVPPLSDYWQEHIDALQLENHLLESANERLTMEKESYRELVGHLKTEIDKMLASEMQSTRFKKTLVGSLVFAIGIVLGGAGLWFPERVSAWLSQPYFVGPMVGAVLAFIYAVINAPAKVGDDSFSSIDRRYREVESNLRTRKSAPERVTDVVEDSAKANDSADIMKALPSSAEEEGFPVSDFRSHLLSIVSGLDVHIKLADEKASKLLDTGTSYIRYGLIFYILSIVGWQIWGGKDGINSLIIAGMISCTVAFIVVEFLAAWFLKQYRSYVDSSMAYMRVRSHWDKFLLSYYVVREFAAGADGSSSRDELMKALSAEIKWPDIKQVNSNDFNYMLESMSSMTLVVEKMKGLIKKPKKTKPKESV